MESELPISDAVQRRRISASHTVVEVNRLHWSIFGARVRVTCDLPYQLFLLLHSTVQTLGITLPRPTSTEENRLV
jgi:hypothetical protein